MLIINNVEIEVPLKYLSNFWRTLCKIDLILPWSTDCVLFFTVGATKFKITDTKLYVPVVTLSTQDNANLVANLQT